MQTPSPILFACGLAAVLAAGCVTRSPHGIAMRPDAGGLRPVALGPGTGNMVEATGISSDVGVWVRSQKTGDRGALAGQQIGLRLYLRNVDTQPHTAIPWSISENGKAVASGKIAVLAPGQETSVSARYDLAADTTRDLHFVGAVNPANTLKEKKDALADNRVAARLSVVPRK